MPNKTCHSIYILLLLIFSINLSYTQSTYWAVILESESNQPIIDALIIQENNIDYTTSDSTGSFYFTISENTTELKMQISTLTCRHNVIITPEQNKTDTIRISCPPLNLNEVVITYTDPKQIVLNAVNKIPQNYFDSTFAVNAFYRHYQKINKNYSNLTEAQSAVLFRLTQQRNALNAEEAIAVHAIRRSDPYFLPDEFHGDDYKDMLSQNPVYHLFTGSLDPEKIDDFKFFMSPLSNDSVWIIYYIAKKYSSENHGITDFNPNDFYGEADETGTLTIDKQTLAFLKIERKALRNKKYHYPKYNNFLYPDNNFTGEFIDGYLLVTYEKEGEKYYPQQILHSYTNEFYATVTYEKVYTITDYFEWFATTPISIIPKQTMQALMDYRSLREFNATYYPEQWIMPLPELKLISKAELFPMLEQQRPLEIQFPENGR